MHQRLFFHAAFEGHAHHGWQRQTNALGIQTVLESAFEKVLKMPILTTGCGRTDAGVHASQYFFHADLPETLPDFDLLQRLNHVLPNEIAIFDQISVAPNAHARWDAFQRQYDYFFHTSKDPFLSTHSAYFPRRSLHLDHMRAAVALLPKYEDYHAFCRSPDRQEHTLCKVRSAQLLLHETGDRYRFQIVSNRFLRGMIRIIMGRILEVGEGKMSVAAFEHYLSARVTPPLIRPAYPNGLHLSKVIYPYLNLPARPIGVEMGTWSGS
jgi:tRNA pseudouridine38-40 synthase